MKQLEKLGSQGSRVLTDNQMKIVTGGDNTGRVCVVGKPGRLCNAALCEVFDPFGNLKIGVCSPHCVCVINYHKL